MPRGKVVMELIENEKDRASTYKKRKRTLMKKAEEFSNLCGVDICLIIYGPKLKNSTTPKLETWPSDSAEVMKVINKYKAMPLDVRQRKCSTVFDFFAGRQKKVDYEISKQHEANFNARFPTWDDRLDNFSVEEDSALMAKLDSKLEAAMKRLLMLMGFKGSNEFLNNGGSKSAENNIVAVPFGTINMDSEVKSQPQPQLPMSMGLNPFQFQMPLPSYYNYPFDFADADADAPPLIQPFNPNPVVDKSMAILPNNNSDFSHQFNEESSYSSSSSCLTYSSISSQLAYEYDPPEDSVVENVGFNNNRPGLQFCLDAPPVAPPQMPSGPEPSAWSSFPPWLEEFLANMENLQVHHGSNKKRKFQEG